MTPTRAELKRATHQRVVDAAGRLFQERGFMATTVRDIAETCGVSIGTVMAVGDKDALLLSAFDALVAAEHDQRTDSSTFPDGDGACADRLVDLVQPFIALFTGRAELARAYASILVSGSHVSALFADLAARLIEEFGRAITLHGCTMPADAPAKASALYFAYVGTLFTWSAKGSVDPSELVASLRATFAAICTCKE